MKRIITVIFFTLLFACTSFIQAQDLGIESIQAPVSACSLSSTENVTVVIKNYDAIPYSGNVSVSYKINAGMPVTEIVTIAVLASGNTMNYTFNPGTANLSLPGSYSFTSYTSLSGDINKTNDTLNGYVVTCYAPSAGGTVNSSDTVCSGTNGTLTLTGQTGSVVQWEYTTSPFTTWTMIADTNPTLAYNNITATTHYRAIVQNGTCAQDTSSTAILTVNPSPNGGVTGPNATVCKISNSGSISLTGYSGTIIYWEQSTDNGATWDSISNTTTVQGYLDLDTTTMYRARVKLGNCDTVSSITTITVNSPSVGGIVTSNATVCSGNNSGILTLSGYTGNVYGWERDEGSGWTPFFNQTPFWGYVNLIKTTMYRAVVQSGVCPIATSSPVTITVDPVSVGGVLNSSSTVCVGSNNGIITLSGFVGAVKEWRYSEDNGTNWPLTSPNTGTTYNYLNLTKTTWYIAIVNSGVCPADTSSIAVITTAPLPTAEAGTDTSISLGYSITLNGSGGTNYSWAPAEGLSNTAAQNPIASPSSTTTYTLTVTDANGCTANNDITITVLEDYKFMFTNLITPNGDGKNDTWYIGNIEEYPLCEVSIYNIYNTELFSASPYNNDWNGTHNGKELPDGTYYYLLKCPDSKKTRKGYITLLRNK